MTGGDLQAKRCMNKRKWPGDDGITLALIKQEGANATKLLAILFFKCLERSDVP